MAPRMAPARTRRKKSQGEQGIALLLVMLLSLILVPFSSEFVMQVYLESTTAVNVADELKIENAIDGQYEVMLAHFRYDGELNETDSADDEWNSEDIRARTEPSVSVALETSVWDEHSKFNLLTLGDEKPERRKLAKERLTRLLQEYRRDTESELSSGDAEQWADQISDYVTKGAVRANLPKPSMQDKSRTIILLDELEFLPAVGDQRFSHLLNDQKDENDVAPGLRRYVTIYGDGKLNLNTVEEVVLQTYFPQNPELSERMIDRRETASEEDETSFSSDDESDTAGNPYTSVEQINEVEGVSAPTLQKNGVDAGLDFTTKSHYFSMRIVGETQTSRRDELFVIERVPGAEEGDAIEGFRLLLRQERTDILETLDAEE